MMIDMAPGPTIELRLLGRFVVLRDDEEIAVADFGGRKVRTLLRLLATRRGQYVPHDVLTEDLWPDRPPADPAANLQVLVNRARKATGAPTLVLTGPGGYALTAGPECRVDAEEFLDAVHAADTATGTVGLAAYRRAFALYGGEPLAEDRYLDWAALYRDRVLASRQAALERATVVALEQGSVSLAVEWAGAAATAEPLREAAALGLVRALAAAGDRAAALQRYERYRRLLAAELGVDPSREAVALQALLLRGEPPKLTTAAAIAAPVEMDELPFVGRQAEVSACVQALADPHAVVLVEGVSGAGKSRLVREIAAAVPSVATHAVWPERSEPWSLIRVVLRELLSADALAAELLPGQLRDALGWLVPDLLHGDIARVDPDSRNALVVEALSRLFSASGLALVIDDLQWADPTSVQAVSAVLERTALPLLLAYRRGDPDINAAAVELLARLSPAHYVELHGLSEEAIRGLADDGLAAALVEGTDRSPMAVAEVLRSMSRRGEAVRDRAGRWRASSGAATARAVELGRLGQVQAISRRARRHTGLEAEVLGLLALLGRQTPARTLALATGQEQRAVLAALGGLSAAALVRLGDLGWVVSHDMVGDAVANALPPPQRAALHGALAQALETEVAEPAEVAVHWLSAGDRDRAAAAYSSAASAAIELGAAGEAETLADAGLALPPAPATAVRLRAVRAQARRRRGDIAGARDDLRAALAGTSSGPGRATLLAQLAMLASGADDLVRAAALVDLALIEAGTDEVARAEALEVGSVLDMNLDGAERAEQRAAEALATYERIGDSRGAARILDARAMAAFIEGDINRGTELLGRVADLFEDYGDLSRLVTPRSTQGHGLVFLGRPAEGLSCTSSALEVATSLGQPEDRAYALWHRSETLSALDRGEEALAEGSEALAVATRLGHRGWTATAWRALGIAHQQCGDPERALAAYSQSLLTSENLELFGCWAAARAALVLVELGRTDEAEPLVRRAMSLGPGLGRYEARLAEVELAHARSDPRTPELAAAALHLARAGGAEVHLPRLTVLSAC